MTLKERWIESTKDAYNSLEDLLDVQEELKEKLKTMKDKNSSKALTYQEICDLKLAEAFNTITDALDIVTDQI